MKTVKDLLTEYGLGQTALARRFGIPLRTVQNWCGGQNTPPDYVIAMMEELLRRDREKRHKPSPPFGYKWDGDLLVENEEERTALIKFRGTETKDGELSEEPKAEIRRLAEKRTAPIMDERKKAVYSYCKKRTKEE